MLEEKEREQLSKGLRIAWIIWGGMLGCLVIYIFIGHFVTMKGGLEPTSHIGVLKNILYCVAAVQLVVVHFLRKYQAYFVRKRMLKEAPPKGQELLLIQKDYRKTVIISLSILDGIGIYGLVLLLLGGGFITFYIFIFVSAIAMLVYRPKLEELEKLALAIKSNA